LLQYICKKICAEDEEFPQAAKALVKALAIKDVDTAYLKTKTGELYNSVFAANAALKEVLNSGEIRDGFMAKMESEIKIVNRELIRLLWQLKKI
jgi:hypothetical protein